MPVLLLTVSGALFSSILSTWLVDRFLAERVSIIGSFVGFERTVNDGIAFGIDLPPWLIATLIPAVLIFVVVLAFRSRNDQQSFIAVGLILGGALGNIIDRFNDGQVTDFIRIGWWPYFNIADSCITVGVLFLLILEFRTKRETRREILNSKF